MAETSNFTASVDRALLKRAKVIAAQQDTSINALVNIQLRHFVEAFESARHHQNDNYAALLDFSLGRIGTQAAMERLGMESDEDLFLLMAQAHLPMPRLDDATTADMVKTLHALDGA